MNFNVAGFRAALGFVLAGSIIVSAISGALSSSAIAFASGNSVGLHAFVGLLVGGLIGWIVGAYAHGIGYTLLSINDHLANISTTLEGRTTLSGTRAAPIVAREATAPAAPLVSQSWREKLDVLAVDNSIEIGGLTVWKLRDRQGNVYFAGDKDYVSIDDVLAAYKVA